MPVRRYRYPVQVDELDRADVKLLTQVLLHVVDQQQQRQQQRQRPESEADRRRRTQIRQMIALLPRHLRNSTLMNLFHGASATTCPTHKGLNRQIIRHAFNLLRQEVTVRLEKTEKMYMSMIMYPATMLGPEEAMVLEYVRSIRGMWIAPSPSSSAGKPSSGNRNRNRIPPWSFQTNRCEACMLARVGSNPRALRDLRTMLLSRNRTETNHPPPRLLLFVQEWINQYEGEDMKLYIYHQSGQQAYAMKEVRKDAVHASCKDRRRQQIRLQGDGSEHARVLNEDRRPEPKLQQHDSNRDSRSASNQPKPSYRSGDGNRTANSKNGIIDAHAAATPRVNLTLEQQLRAMNLPPWLDGAYDSAAGETTPRVNLTLEQQLGVMNLTPWPGYAYAYNAAAGRAVSQNTVSVNENHSRNSQAAVFIAQQDGAGESDSRAGDFHIYAARSSGHESKNNSPDEYRILATYGDDSGSGSEYTDCTPPGTPRALSLAKPTWSLLYNAAAEPNPAAKRAR
ncbi:hypothetical protein VTN77DRAFT_3208 [Rasamsonia byssochlamydoides]|uniref:uncharacterized protein n=1 Tax=Rasamsonia byssochlamydoides TaxID=89139 RepID=UPI0037434A5B